VKIKFLVPDELEELEENDEEEPAAKKLKFSEDEQQSTLSTWKLLYLQRHRKSQCCVPNLLKEIKDFTPTCSKIEVLQNIRKLAEEIALVSEELPAFTAQSKIDSKEIQFFVDSTIYNNGLEISKSISSEVVSFTFWAEGKS
jgi:hypothetical protein